VKNKIDILKGIHPGIVLERELRKNKLGKGQFAMSIGEYPQTFSAIISGKRSMNTPLALRIENALGIEEGFFMTLQLFYDIAQEKKKLSNQTKPDISKMRPVLFWDTSIDNIDWQKHKAFVIARVFERGNMAEKKEILRFYGHKPVKEILQHEALTY